MLRIAPDLPDALVGITCVRNGGVDHLGDALPHGMDDLGRPHPEVDLHGVEEHPPHVVLVLVPRSVAYPHRPRVPPARQVVEGVLGQVLPTVDAVHDLQVEVAAGPAHRLDHEGEVLERLPVEPEPVERSQHEGGIADPGVAIVPVARPTGCLGERGRRRRHDGTGGRIAQALERQRAALYVAAPGMVGEGPVGQPLPPVGHRCVELALRLFEVRGLTASPGQGGKGGLAPVQGGAAVAAGGRRAQAEGGRQGEVRIAGRGAHGHGVVAVARVGPGPGLRAVLENGDGVGHHLDPALEAGGQAQQRARGGVVAGSPAVVGATGLVTRRLDDQEVVDEEPAGGGVPGGLEHHGPGHVAPVVGHHGAGGTEPEIAGGAIEEGPEDTGGVGPGETQPLDRAVRSHETAVLAVREEPIVGDGGKGLCLNFCGFVFGHPVDAREPGCRSQGQLFLPGRPTGVRQPQGDVQVNGDATSTQERPTASPRSNGSIAYDHPSGESAVAGARTEVRHG